MRVLHLSSALSWRGGEQQITYLIEELRKLDVENVVFCPINTPLADYAAKNQYEVLTYHKKNLDPRVSRYLTRICKDHHIDIIHIHDSHAHTYAVMAASLFRNRTPLILSRRVDFPIKRNLFSKWKYNHPKIRKILCVSRAILKILEPDIHKKGKLEVVYSGIDPARIKKSKGILHKEFAIPENQLIIANIASIAPHKDYYTFVNTIADLKSNWPNELFPKVFIIGGDGGERESIVQYILQKNLHEEIILTGFRNDIGEIIGELNLLLVTSKEEGLCTTILDAFTAGIPVVATAAGGIPEIVHHLQTGLLAPIRDHEKLSHWIVKLFKDTQLKNRLIKKSQILVQEFDKSKTAKMTLEHYSSSL